MSYNKETGMYEGYVYKITNLINRKIYIGITKRNIKIRFNEHATCVKRQPNRPSVIGLAIEKYGKENFNIEVLEKIELDTNENLNDKLNILEKQYVKKFQSYKKEIGYNRTMGGDSAANQISKRIVQYDINENIVNIYESETQGSIETGVPVGDISKCCRGKGTSYLAGGFYWTFEGEPIRKSKYNIIKNREIDKYDLDGNLICEFKCTNDISDNKKLLNRIRNCCKGRTYNVDGYVYRYKGDSFDKYPCKNKQIINNSIVNQYSLDNIYINTYQTMKNAGEINNIDPSCISDACRKKTKTAGKYKWYYANDPEQPDKLKIIV